MSDGVSGLQTSYQLNRSSKSTIKCSTVSKNYMNWQLGELNQLLNEVYKQYQLSNYITKQTEKPNELLN